MLRRIVLIIIHYWLLPKRDEHGTFTAIRVCLDTRGLNLALIVNDKFLIPSPILKHLEGFAGCSQFGDGDLREAYLQTLLDEESQPYTAFTWGGVQYMFRGCPFGINLLPSRFQRTMSYVFSDLPYVFPYFDNIVFASKSVAEQ